MKQIGTISKRWRSSIPLLLCLFFAQIAIAQVRISGQVLSGADGSTVIGATVKEKGASNGAITDIDGNFTIEVSDANATLVFNYTGFTQKEVALNGQTRIAVTIDEDAGLLNEIVVVGYGTQKKSDLTGAVGTVKARDIERIPSASVDQALQGKIAGVYVTPASGEPGASAFIRIRGTGTLNNSNPLFVVDGMLLDDISFVNPQDVESVEVLKDASATAIYGNRGANGVIIITTKRGTSGRSAIVSLSTYYGNQQIAKKLSLLNASEFAQMYNEYKGTNFYTDPAALGTGTDWQDVIFRDAPIANVQLGVNGVWKKLQYNLSGNYFNQSGILEKTAFDRKTGRINAEYPVAKFLKVGTSVAYSSALLKSVNGGIIGSAYRMSPVFAERDSTGDFTDPTFFGQALANPAADLFYKSDWRNRVNRLVGTFYTDITLFKDFTFRTNLGLDKWGVRLRYFEPAFEVSNSQRNPYPRTSRDTTNVRSWLWENTLTWNKEFENMTLNVLGGQSAQEYRNELRRTINDTLQPNGQEIREWAMFSFIFRTNATFFDRYLLTVSLRADGSSRFAKGNRWGYFPSVAVGWNIAQEPFMRGQKVFDRLKLRASWGIVGNDKTQEYPSQGIITDELYAVFGPNETLDSGATLINYANPDVVWESAHQTDIGLEFAMFNGRLSAEVDWYRRFTSNILADLPIPDYVGSQATPVVNSAQVRNTGWDFTLNWRETRGKVTYNFGGILSLVDNEVVKLNQAKSEILSENLGQGFVTRTVPGQPIGSFYGYQVDGIFQNTEELSQYPKFGNEKPGDFRYKDLNGDGILSDLDRGFLGSPIPTTMYGFNAGIEVFGFDLGADVFGISGNKVMNAKAASTRFAVYNWERLFFDGRWTGEGTSNSVPRASEEGLQHNTRMSDFFIEDGSFLRLRSVVIGYSLPRHLLSGIGMSRLRFYASGTNLWTKQDYSGFSPEFPSNNPYAVGLDRLYYPMSKTILFGLNATF